MTVRVVVAKYAYAKMAYHSRGAMITDWEVTVYQNEEWWGGPYLLPERFDSEAEAQARADEVVGQEVKVLLKF